MQNPQSTWAKAQTNTHKTQTNTYRVTLRMRDVAAVFKRAQQMGIKWRSNIVKAIVTNEVNSQSSGQTRPAFFRFFKVHFFCIRIKNVEMQLPGSGRSGSQGIQGETKGTTGKSWGSWDPGQRRRRRHQHITNMS